MLENDKNAKAEAEKPQEYYPYYYKGLKIDPYRIFEIYQIHDGPRQNAIKKLLAAGTRSAGKCFEQDIAEAITALERLLEMCLEDSEIPAASIRADLLKDIQPGQPSPND